MPVATDLPRIYTVREGQINIDITGQACLGREELEWPPFPDLMKMSVWLVRELIIDVAIRYQVLSNW